MATYSFKKDPRRLFTRVTAVLIAVSLILQPALGYSQGSGQAAMIAPGTAFTPVLLKGMILDARDPLKLDFIVDSGDIGSDAGSIQEEAQKLVQYFLASMTIPKGELWVNLSPYENDRIIPEALGQTDLGRDLLAQDYLLKQFTASLIYPEKELGKKFWDTVYTRAQEKFGTSEIPVNTFNKVWILPESATVFQKNGSVYIVRSKLKVMLDSDHRAMTEGIKDTGASPGTELTENILREVVLPEIEKEVNEGKSFASLRQIYHALILAKWYKETIKNGPLAQSYVDQQKVAGVESDEQGFKERIYHDYADAYKKGAYNYIKEDAGREGDEVVARKYFSGGFQDKDIVIARTSDPAEAVASIKGESFTFTLDLEPIDRAEEVPEDILTQKLIGVKNKEVDHLIEELRSTPGIARTVSREETILISRTFVPGAFAADPGFQAAFPDFDAQISRVQKMLIDDNSVILHEINQIDLLDTFLVAAFSFKDKDDKLHIYYTAGQVSGILHEMFEQKIFSEGDNFQRSQKHTLAVLAELGFSNDLIGPRFYSQLQAMNFSGVSGFFRSYDAVLHELDTKFGDSKENISITTKARHALAVRFAGQLHALAKDRQETLGAAKLKNSLMKAIIKELADQGKTNKVRQFFKDFWPIVRPILAKAGRIDPDFIHFKNALLNKKEPANAIARDKTAVKEDLFLLLKRLEQNIPGLKQKITLENVVDVALDVFRKAAIIRTGGTLEMAGAEGRTSVGAIDQMVDAYINEVGYVEKAVPELPDSSNIGLKEWAAIIAKISSVIETKQKLGQLLRELGEGEDVRPAGVVVTCGTDTSDHIGLILSLALPQDMYVPVALTAAGIPLGQKGSDVESNFSFSLEIVQSQDIPPLVYFVYNNTVHLAARIRKFIAGDPANDKNKKLSAEHRDFESYGDIVGEKHNGKLVINNSIYALYLKKLAGKAWGGKQMVSDNVEYLVISNDHPTSMFQDAQKRILATIKEKPGERAGLIIQGKWPKGASKEDLQKTIDILERLRENKVPVFVGSRELADVLNGAKVILLPKFFYFGKARLKLAWLLAQGVPFEDIGRAMSTNIVGELPREGVGSLWDDFPLSHNEENFGGGNRQDEVVVAYPNIKTSVYADALARAFNTPEKRLVIYAFGDGNLPLGDGSLDAPLERGLNNVFPDLIGPFQANLQELRRSPELSPLEAFELAMTRVLEQLAPQRREEILSRYAFMDLDKIISNWTKEALTHAKETGRLSTKDPQGMVRFFQETYPDLLEGTEISSIKEMKTILHDRLQQRLDPEKHQAFYMQFLARRIIKDALMAANPILKEFGTKIDRGVEIMLLTTAVGSNSNHATYGLGNLLYAVGLDSKMHPGWAPAFIPKDIAQKPSDLGGIDMNDINIDLEGDDGELLFKNAGEGLSFIGLSPTISGFTPLSTPLLLLELAS